MKVSVNRDACIACGACAGIAPDVFELDGEGIAVPVVEEVPAALETDAQDALEACPTEALSTG